MKKYGWVFGLLCLPAGGWHMYLYFGGTGTLGLVHLIVGLFTLAAGVYNLISYARLWRLI